MDSQPQNAELPFDNSPQFRLKAGLYPLTQLDISHYEYSRFDEQLRAKAAEAPAFFQHTPVVLNFEPYGDQLAPPLRELAALCQEHGLIPVAISSRDEALHAAAREAGLAILSVGRAAREPAADPAPKAEAPFAEAPSAPAPELAAAKPTRVIDTPIRSGQQVYAAGGDLIVLSAVSAGAEVLADGNIHIYGALRGRALAGVKGDTSAQIFCQSLEAELVSVAGTFMLDEDLREAHWKSARRIRLNDQTLDIQPLN